MRRAFLSHCRALSIAIPLHQQGAMASTKTNFGAWFAEQGGAAATPMTIESISSAASAGSKAAMTSASAGMSSLLARVGNVAAGTLTSPTPSPIATPPLPPTSNGVDVEQGGAPGDGFAAYVPSMLRRNPLASSAPAPPEWTCGLTIAQRFQLFLLFMAGSAVLFSISIFVFLPVAILMPGKFASGFSFASVFFMLALALLRGPRTTLMGLLVPERLPFTAAYLGSLILTLYATLVVQSYLLILLAVMVQGAALLWYGSSFLPGGTVGMALFSRFAARAVGTGARGLASAVTGSGSGS